MSIAVVHEHQPEFVIGVLDEGVIALKRSTVEHLSAYGADATVASGTQQAADNSSEPVRHEIWLRFRGARTSAAKRNSVLRELRASTEGERS